MVTKFRNAGKSLVGRIVIGLFFGVIALSFALWGIGDIFRGDTNPVVATVGKSEIKVADLQREFNNNVNNLSRQFGQEISPSQAIAMGMLNSSLSQVINQRLLEEEARDLGMGISDEAIVTRIQQNPAFQDASGRYSADSLRTRLRNAGISEAEFIQGQKTSVLSNQLFGSLAATAFGSDTALDLIARYDSEKRGMDWVLVPADAAVAAPDDAELEEYLAGDAGAQFERPEYRSFDIIQLAARDVVKIGDDFTEEDVLAEYEAVKASLGTPEQRRVEQISFADEAAATDALRRIQAGEDFAAVAKETAGLEADELSLGLVQFAELPESYARAAFSLENNAVSEPVETALGWRLFRVSEIVPGVTPSFAEVRADIERRLVEPLASDRFYELTKDIEDRLAGGETMQEIAAALNLSVENYVDVAASGAQATGGNVATLKDPVDILRTVFSTDLDTDSGVIETDNGILYALIVKNITDATKPQLADIRLEVLTAWRAEEQAIAAETKAREMVETLNGGAALADLARENALVVANSPVVTRYESLGDAPLDASVLARLFETQKGKAFEVAAANGARIVAVASVVEAGEKLVDQEARDLARGRLNQSMRSDILSGFAATLNGKHDVVIKEAVIARYFLGNGALQ